VEKHGKTIQTHAMEGLQCQSLSCSAISKLKDLET